MRWHAPRRGFLTIYPEPEPRRGGVPDTSEFWAALRSRGVPGNLEPLLSGQPVRLRLGPELAAAIAWLRTVSGYLELRPLRFGGPLEGTRRRRDILEVLRQRPQIHGLRAAGELVGPHGSGGYGATALRRAEAAGIVRIVPCLADPRALDVLGPYGLGCGPSR